MTSDITLELPDKTRVNTLAITAAPRVYNDLVQRVICTLFFTNSGITVNGQTAYQLLQTVSSMPESAVGSRLAALADNVKTRLNEEGYCISSLDISVVREEDSANIVFNITPAGSSESITEVFYT